MATISPDQNQLVVKSTLPAVLQIPLISGGNVTFVEHNLTPTMMPAKKDSSRESLFPTSYLIHSKLGADSFLTILMFTTMKVAVNMPVS
jgi:hypothetical protein